MCIQYTIWKSQVAVSLVLKMSSAYGQMSKQPQCLLEWQTCPDISSVTPSNLRGLLPQYIEDRRHKFPAYLFCPSLWWWLFSKGKMFFICVNLMKTLQESEAEPFILLRTMVTFFFIPGSLFSLPAKAMLAHTKKFFKLFPLQSSVVVPGSLLPSFPVTHFACTLHLISQ